jgi:beta-xylosidase
VSHDGERGEAMSVEAVMLWTEPNNRAHWDFDLDVGWKVYAEMVKLAAREIRRERPTVTQVLGGMAPIDPEFVENMKGQGVLDVVDAVAVDGFPLDWSDWQLEQWPDKLDEIRAVTEKPIWVSAVGVSTFGAEEVQELGLRKTADLLLHRSPRVHWYSLYDLPRVWLGARRERETRGSAYCRQFYMGLLEENGKPKRALRRFASYTPALGLCQWFQYQDARLEDAALWMKRLGVKKLRTGLSWADSHRPDADAWFDRQMKALEPFDVTVTFCFTPGSRGVRDDHTSPPRSVDEYAEFCTRMVRRYC